MSNKRKHVAPDVFVVIGVAKKKREYYLTWEEGKNPTVVIEITSSSTRQEDIKKEIRTLPRRPRSKGIFPVRSPP